MDRLRQMLTLLDQLETTPALGNASVPACLLADLPAGAVADRDGVVRIDLGLTEGRISEVAKGGSIAQAVDLQGRMVWPAFIDLHTHLDKGHIWPRAANPDGTFAGALNTVRADREKHWSATDVHARFEFGLRCAFAHGTRAIRTHLDSIPPQAQTSFRVMAELRDRWRGRIELQAVSLGMFEHYEGANGAEIADIVAAHGGILGLVPLMRPDIDQAFDRFFALAIDRGLAIDCHIDETKDPAASALRHLADAAIRNGYVAAGGKGIVAGHCCSLAQQPADEVESTLDRVAEAQIAIVSLPMCNMYLQDRASHRTPRWRGVTLLHELRARGIPVALASDNCRDPFFAYGDLDMHEVFREGVRIAQLDHPLGDWPRTVTATPAAIMRLDAAGLIGVGERADLVIFEGRRFSEILARPESRRIVLRDGQPLDATPPGYAELDELMGESTWR